MKEQRQQRRYLSVLDMDIVLTKINGMKILVTAPSVSQMSVDRILIWDNLWPKLFN